MIGLSYPETDLARYGLPIKDGGIDVGQAFSDWFQMWSVWGEYHTRPTAVLYRDAQAEKLLRLCTDYMLAACLGEARHVWSRSNLFAHPASHPLRSRLKWLRPFRHKERDNCGKVIWDTIDLTPRDAALFCERVFIEPVWLSNNFGGTAWGYIARCVVEFMDILSKRDPLEIVLALDKITHIAHTGCSVLQRAKFSWFNSGCLHRIIAFKSLFKPCCWSYARRMGWTILNEEVKDLLIASKNCNMCEENYDTALKAPMRDDKQKDQLAYETVHKNSPEGLCEYCWINPEGSCACKECEYCLEKYPHTHPYEKCPMCGTCAYKRPDNYTVVCRNYCPVCMTHECSGVCKRVRVLGLGRGCLLTTYSKRRNLEIWLGKETLDEILAYEADHFAGAIEWFDRWC